MDDTINQITNAVASLQQHLTFILMLLGLLYTIHALNWLINYRLNMLGVYPRKLFGLSGVIFYPFLHSNFNHLFFNSIPLFILASFVLLKGFPTFFCVSITIGILSGLGIWVIGRRGFHVGASGLIMGYWSYLILDAYQQKTIISIAPAVICLYYFGGFLLHLFPTEVKSSWEAHLCGFLAGLTAAYTCPSLFCKLSTMLCLAVT
jgi:membrane associated rhomboid family serine protease